MKRGVAPGTVKESFQPRSPPWSNAMQSFISRHQVQIQGTMSGFDRLRFMGSLRMLSFAKGWPHVLPAAGVLLKAFGTDAKRLSKKTRMASEARARPTPAGRVLYCVGSAGMGQSA